MPVAPARTHMMSIARVEMRVVLEGLVSEGRGESRALTFV